jgi:hypothetical protein
MGKAMADDVAAPDSMLAGSKAHCAGEREFDGVAFEAIESAVMETERGRWFLREFARRVRAEEMTRVEAALARIEQRLPLAPSPVRDAETRIVALSVYRRLLDLAAALRATGVDEDSCARIEAQANALIDLARRRNLIEAAEMLEQGLANARATPAA